MMSWFSKKLLGAASLVSAGLLALQVGSASSVEAQGVPQATALSGRAVMDYWTPARMKAAVPLDAIAAGSAAKAKTETFKGGKSEQSAGSPPTLEVGDDLAVQLFEPDAIDDAGASPRNFGTAGYYHTTSRLFPVQAVRAYPNRAAGKLFFSDSVHGGNFVCSASAIQKRVVITAGHCVAHGSGNAGTRHFYSNMLFVPAYNNGAAPYGKWPWAYAVTTNNWYLSGSVPNLQDVGAIEVRDITYRGNLATLGNITGWLGWWTLWGRQYPNAITQLGYPCNLDSCQLEQINHAQGVRVVNGNVEIGSAMQGGSSGGPWIQDHGIAGAGSPAFTAGNWVLGTTSYQYLGTPSPQILGSSIFQNAGFGGHGFGDVWNTVCAHRAGNC